MAGGGVTVKGSVVEISWYFVVVDVMVVVHLSLDVVVTVLVTVVRGTREEQAQEMVAGLQVDKAVGVEADAFTAGVARADRLLTTGGDPLDR